MIPPTVNLPPLSQDQAKIIPPTVDVLLVGGGPTSLLITFILLRSGVKAHAIEQHPKASQVLLGRASFLYSASLEFFDSLGIYDSIADVGCIVKKTATYKNGQKVPSRGWGFVQDALQEDSTFFKYSMGIRQRYIEGSLRSAISELDQNAIHTPAKLVDYQVRDTGEHPVLATIEAEGRTIQVACKYLIGADGGRSFVRSIGKFSFPGIASPFKWIRLDALVKTDMPSSRDFISIESEKYGNVLWVPVDHGRTRIGFVCPDEVYGKDGSSITKDIVMETARKALLPFNLEFVSLEWWTVYQIGQRVAQTFRNGPVFLAGDAAHTHSSGAAQGMNTGMHDAYNLAWKLAGVLTGKFKESVLDTYDLERRPAAKDLIAQDKDVSSLISGKIPDHFNAPADADPSVYLDRVFRENAQFTVGLGISYDFNDLNRPNPNFPKVKIGHRAPDVLVYPAGPHIAQRLRSFLPHTGKFWILVFAGQLSAPEDEEQQPVLSSELSTKYQKLREHLYTSSRSLSTVANFVTILCGQSVILSSEAIGVAPLGKVLFDSSGEAYDKYGIDPQQGAVLTVRPDGIVSSVDRVDNADQLSAYFASFSNLQLKEQREYSDKTAIFTAGEISVEGQEERTEKSANVN